MDQPRIQWILASFLCGCLLAVFWRADAAESLESVQSSAAELGRVRAETIELETSWRWQSETLGASIEALKEQRLLMQQKHDLLEAESLVERVESEKLANKVEAARAMLDEVDQRLREMGTALIAMRPWLPPRLASAVELPCRSLGDPALPPGERMQHLSTVWSRCLQFDRAITFVEEPVTPPGEEHPRVMEVIYWGLGVGYALDRSRALAYVGSPGKDGWRWSEEHGIAPRVAQLIAIHQDRADPRFVAIPVQVTNPLEGPTR